MIISTEPDNEIQYREEIGNTYNKLMDWKRNLPKKAPGKDFINELTKLINEYSRKSSNRELCL